MFGISNNENASNLAEKAAKYEQNLNLHHC